MKETAHRPNRFLYFNLVAQLAVVRHEAADAQFAQSLLRGHFGWVQEEFDQNGPPVGLSEHVELVPALVITRILTGAATPGEMKSFGEPLDAEFRALVMQAAADREARNRVLITYAKGPLA